LLKHHLPATLHHFIHDAETPPFSTLDFLPIQKHQLSAVLHISNSSISLCCWNTPPSTIIRQQAPTLPNGSSNSRTVT
jgi:hypothetical protein